MAMLLPSLLDKHDPLLASGILDLEKLSGRGGIDTRLIADMLQLAHGVMRQMHLDLRDTTAEELYHSLNAQVDNPRIEKMLLDCDYVLYKIDDHVISFNLIDIVENAHHELAFEDRIVDHGKRALRGALIERYAKSGKIDNSVLESRIKSMGLKKPEDAEHIINVKSYKLSHRNAPFMLAIGDMVTDAFIKLLEDKAEVVTDDTGHQKLMMDFGSKPPYDRVDILNAVGNSANAAVAFSRLGLNASLMAFCGDDQAGRDSLNYLHSENVDTSLMSVAKDKKTNYHFALRYGADRTILIKYEDYDYEFNVPKEEPDWIYLSMLSKSSWDMHKQLLAYLKKHPSTKLAFQPGTFHFEWGTKRLQEIYKRSYIVIMNKEEAELVTGKDTNSISELVRSLHALGPEFVIITDGPNGSYASDGKTILAMPNYPDPAPPFDRTGAGDAFASTIVAALAMGESLETAMLWAPINSMSVVQLLGAQAGLLKLDKIKKYLKDAPVHYRAQEIKI